MIGERGGGFRGGGWDKYARTHSLWHPKVTHTVFDCLSMAKMLMRLYACGIIHKLNLYLEHIFVLLFLHCAEESEITAVDIPGFGPFPVSWHCQHFVSFCVQAKRFATLGQLKTSSKECVSILYRSLKLLLQALLLITRSY